MEPYLKIRVKGDLGEVEMTIDKNLFGYYMPKNNEDRYTHALDGVIKVYKGLGNQNEQ